MTMKKCNSCEGYRKIDNFEEGEDVCKRCNNVTVDLTKDIICAGCNKPFKKRVGRGNANHCGECGLRKCSKCGKVKKETNENFWFNVMVGAFCTDCKDCRREYNNTLRKDKRAEAKEAELKREAERDPYAPTSFREQLMREDWIQKAICRPRPKGEDTAEVLGLNDDISY